MYTTYRTILPYYSGPIAGGNDVGSDGSSGVVGSNGGSSSDGSHIIVEMNDMSDSGSLQSPHQDRIRSVNSTRDYLISLSTSSHFKHVIQTKPNDKLKNGNPFETLSYVYLDHI